MCESLVWDRGIIGKGSIKAGLNWVEGLFAWPLMGDQRAGDPALTAPQRQAIICLSALCINPSGAGILALKGRQRRRRDDSPRAELARLRPPLCGGQGSWTLDAAPKGRWRWPGLGVLREITAGLPSHRSPPLPARGRASG